MHSEAGIFIVHSDESFSYIYAGKGGISSQTIITVVVPTVVSVGIFSISCYCFICRKPRKTYDNIKGGNGKSIINLELNI